MRSTETTPFRQLFTNAKFWVFVFFAIRLIGITHPPVEVGHHWRQVTGLMVARNFVETDPNPFYPQVDETLGKSGIIAMEFPSMNYLYYTVANVFGYTHWYGRLINLIISSLGLYFFYLLLSNYFKQRVALLAMIFLASSIWFSFSRKMMPDTYCISLMIIALYYAERFFRSGKIVSLSLYILFSSLAVLSKIPAAIYFFALIPLLFIKGNRQRKIALLSTTIIPLAATYLWYFWWNPHLASTYGNWYNTGQTLSQSIDTIASNLPAAAKKFYFEAFSGFILFAFFIIGFVTALFRKEKLVLFLFFAVFIPFVVFIVKAGFFFVHHSYYIIPFVPVMALIAAYGIAEILSKKWLIIAASIACVESIANQSHDFILKRKELYKLELEAQVNQQVPTNALVVINGGANPQQLYFAHRDGWTCTNEQLMDTSYIHQASLLKAAFVIINRKQVNWTFLPDSTHPYAIIPIQEWKEMIRHHQ